jgi:hypothetical protein
MPVIAAIMAAAILMSFQGVSNEAMQMKEDLGARESIAMAVERTPDLWLEQIEAQKGKMNDFEYLLARQQATFFASKAPGLAQQVRDEKFWATLTQGGWIIGKQVAQIGAGKAVGSAARHIIGPRLVSGGVDLLSKGVLQQSKTYEAIGTHLGRSGRILTHHAGEVIGSTASDLAWETASGLSNDPSTMSPALQKAMENPQWQQLFVLIEEAKERDTQKLLQAALFHHINLIDSRKGDMNDDEYRAFVMSYASKLARLTRAGGSSNSMWETADDLAKWLAAKAGRALPDAQATGPTKPIDINNFMATGSFFIKDDSETMEKSRDFIWDENSLDLNMNNGKVSGSGRLFYKEPGIDYKWQIFFYFDATFINRSGSKEIKGDFKDGKVLIKQQQTGIEGESQKTTTFTASLEGNVISGEIVGWLEDFSLSLVILNDQEVD